MDIRVVHGSPTPQELAAVLAVLLPRLRGAGGEPRSGFSRWRAGALPGAPDTRWYARPAAGWAASTR